MMICRKTFSPLGLQVYTGVELGNPHRYAKEAHALLDDYPFDIVIGSVHWLYGVNIHDAVVFQGRDLNTVYSDYFEEVRHLCEDFPVDILAHFDRILWRATMLDLPFNPQPIEKTIRTTLATVARRGVAIELNTRHLALSPTWHENLVTMLHWYKEEGGHGMVVNSDAHRTSHITMNFDRAADMLSDIGLTAITPERLGEITFA